MKTSVLEKPWYTPVFHAFLCMDVPRVLQLPARLFAPDFLTLERRLAAEGESFVTKTLPGFCKAFDLALQGGQPLATQSFKKKRGSALPVFLQALLRRVFQDDGWVRDTPCIISIRLVRQICLWCKKVQKGFSPESTRKAIQDVIDVDGSLPDLDYIYQDRVSALARGIIELVVRHFDAGKIKPAHGPGSVAGGEGVVGKRDLRHSYAHLERVFRPIPFFFSLRDAAEDPQRVTERMHCNFAFSKLALVEKDSGGPRVIGLEPGEYMWCQQALKRWLYPHIESHRITRGQVNFVDQTINQRLALEWKDYDTLDMSKASDRVSYALVHTLFRNTRLWPFLHASRTPGTILPDGRVLLFRKFAPMGSAVCFPIESLVFYALTCSILHIAAGMPLLLTFKRVFVYGDDLVVPHGTFPILEKYFAHFRLKFNADKCCTLGKFRESCGLDAYDGVNVTPVRMRKVYPRDAFASDLAPVVEHCNALYTAGYRSSSAVLRDAALKTFPLLRKLQLPFSARTDLPFLVWVTKARAETVKYLTKDSITYAKGWHPEPVSVQATEEGEMKYLRESLSRGGPVGHFKNVQGLRVRLLDMKYSVILRKRRFIVTRVLSEKPRVIPRLDAPYPEG